MRMLWATSTVAAPSTVVWELITNLDSWPRWGPTVRSAELDGDTFTLGATGHVTTIGGVRLPFVITDFEPGQRWSWRVAGIDATAHHVEEIRPGRTRVGIGVSVLAAPYLAVCRLAVGRIVSLATA